jgi:hypothetical protein
MRDEDGCPQKDQRLSRLNYGVALLTQQGGWTLGELQHSAYATGGIAGPTDWELALIEAMRRTSAQEMVSESEAWR